MAANKAAKSTAQAARTKANKARAETAATQAECERLRAALRECRNGIAQIRGMAARADNDALARIGSMARFTLVRSGRIQEGASMSEAVIIDV